MQPSLLHTWEALQPNCNQIHTITKIKKKKKRPARRPSCAPAPDLTKDSRSRGKHSVTPLPDFSSFWSRSPVPPRGPHSVLSSSVVSSVGCWRLGTWCLGLPLVHHRRVGSLASHSQTPTRGRMESMRHSSHVRLPRAPERWQDAGSFPLPSFSHTHGPAEFQKKWALMPEKEWTC